MEKDVSLEINKYYAPYIKSAGILCYMKSCKKKYSEDRQTRSTFAFPKDATRCAIWINKCGCEHLKVIDPAILNKKYRLCSLHFEDCMNANFQKNRLESDAIPTLFDHEEVSVTSNNETNTNKLVITN